RRERRDPPADRDMGEPACGAQRARSRRDSCLSVGPELNRRMTDSNDPEILFDRRGTAGIVTLNRPHALNAVTHAMVRALSAQLHAWAHDPAITRVIVTAAGGRAFSAGGDIRALYDLGRAGRPAEALAFWREEYTLNSFIKHYPKP